MNALNRIGVALASGVAMAACAAAHESTPNLADIPLLCVRTNDANAAPNFVADLQSSLAAHGIKTQVYGDPAPADCRFRALYWTEYRHEAKGPALSAATLRIYDRDRLIGQVSFDYADVTRTFYGSTDQEKVNYLVSILYPPPGIPGGQTVKR